MNEQSSATSCVVVLAAFSMSMGYEREERMRALHVNRPFRVRSLLGVITTHVLYDAL